MPTIKHYAPGTTTEVHTAVHGSSAGSSVDPHVPKHAVVPIQGGAELSTANPLPTADETAAITLAAVRDRIGATTDAEASGNGTLIAIAKYLRTLVGALAETAPASDTASSGLNGRMQRVAQRLTSLIGLLPASVGQKARAASLAVTLSTEDVTALTTGTTPVVTGAAAHDAAVSGAPILQGAVAQNTLPTAVSADGDAVRLAADRYGIQYTRGTGRTIEATPTVTATTYAALDSVGGKITLANAFRAGAGIFIQSVRVMSVPSPALKLILFRDDPSASTFTNDAAIVLAFADHGKVVAVIEFDEVQSIDGNTYCAHWAAGSPGLGLLVRPSSGTTLYAALQSTGAMTSGGTTDFHLLIEAYDE